MFSKTIAICSSILLFLIILERSSYPNNVVINMYFRSEFGGRELEKRKLFSDYLKKFNKSYGPDEIHKRFRHFKRNLKEIERLNDGRNDALFGVTKFSDWSKQELQKMLSPELGKSHCESKALSCDDSREGARKRFFRKERKINKRKDVKVPKKMDWRKKGVIGPIINQRFCKVCWAATIAGVMESMAAINGHSLRSLSIQQLMDCTFYQETDKTGCVQGRPPVEVFEYLCHTHTLLAPSTDYPTTLVEERCKHVHGVIGLKKFNNSCTMHNNERNLVEALSKGPVTAMVWANMFFNYNSGVISRHCQVATDQLNHAIQIVGYDTTSSPPYYIVKNSWGDDWGEKGYVRLAIGGNQCGIAYSIGMLNVY